MAKVELITVDTPRVEVECGRFIYFKGCNKIYMKILIYMPFSNWVSHFATDLEIAAKHIDEGDDVHIIQCSGDLTSCEPNRSHTKLRCVACKYNRDKGLALINLPEQNRHELDLNNFFTYLDVPDFSSIEELKSFEINNVDIGMAVASTLISKTREHNPNLNDFKNDIHDSSVFVMHNNFLSSVEL